MHGFDRTHFVCMQPSDISGGSPAGETSKALSSEETDKSFDLKSALGEAKKYWAEKYRIAQENMKEQSEKYGAVLIEVASQHPLLHGREPNTEFRKRLDKAIELYREWTAQGVDVCIYVPGSRHKYEGVADDISLSEAGCAYLRSEGIPENVLFGIERNARYKGEDGVYNSADECYVASRIFFDGAFSKLVCVCSPNQIMRKTMFYIEFGCFPVCYGVTTENMYHANVVEEIFTGLNTVLYFDHSWQDKSTAFYESFRKERKP